MIVLGAMLATAGTPAQGTNYQFVRIADSTQVPGLSGGRCVSVNAGGSVVFATADGTVWRGDGNSLGAVAASGPAGQPLTAACPGLNDSGDVVYGFASSSPAYTALVRNNGGLVTELARSDAAPFIVEPGATAVHSVTGSGHTVATGADGKLYVVPAATPAYTLGPSDPPLSSILAGTMNDSNVVAFRAQRQVAGVTRAGIYRGGGTPLVEEGATVPIIGAAPPAINNSGEVVFLARWPDGSARVLSTSDGVTFTDHSGSTAMAAADRFSINDAGLVVFASTATGGNQGLFTGPNPAADKVIAPGDSLAGSTVVRASVWHDSINDLGQISFWVELANGRTGVYRADPVLAPVAVDGTLTTIRNTPASGSLSASDPLGVPLTYGIVSNGTRGTAAISNPSTGAFTYTPAANSIGTDTFTFRANNGSRDSNIATVTVTIGAGPGGNSPPVAQDLGSSPAAAVRFDTIGESLTRTTALPPIGSFTIMGWFRIAATPTAYSTFMALGATSTSTNVYRLMRTTGSGGVQNLHLYTGTTGYLLGSAAPSGSWNHLAVTVAGTGANQVKAYLNGALKVTTGGNASTIAQKFFIGTDGRDMWLNGSAAGVKIYDAPLGDAEIVQEMQQFAPVRTSGLNAFYPLQSAAAATLDGGPLNRPLTAAGALATDASGPPVTVGTPITTAEDAPLTGTLTGTDPDANPLTYTIVTNGARGTAVVTNPATGAFTYTPNPDVTGTDTFTFKANDGLLDSNVASVAVLVTPANDAPVAADGTVTVAAGASVNGTLVATDVDGPSRTFAIVTNGAKGAAAITNATTGAYTYTANSGSSGSDTFTFRVSDGSLVSNVATITVSITAQPNPVANNGSLAVTEDTAANGTLTAVDPNGAALTYAIVTNGAKGSAMVTNTATGAFTYTPGADATGSDSFTFRASNGAYTSNTATVAVTIAAVNDAPVAVNGTASVGAGGSVNGTLIATDVDSASRTFTIVANGTKGTASITNAATGAYTYSANAGASGTDTFTFRANDGSLNSNVASVTVTIAPAPNPVASNGSLAVTEDVAASGALVAIDPNGAALTYAIVTNGAKGSAAITNSATGAFTYTPGPNATGSDSFTFRASNATHTSNTATIAVTIASVNDPPVAVNGTASVVGGTSVTGTLAATDVDSASRTFAIVANGAKGTAAIVDASTGAYSYTANAGASGTDTFTFRANDGSLDSNVATITVTIAPAGGGNNAPVASSMGTAPSSAVRFDAMGESLTRTTSLPPIGSFTMMGWFRVGATPTAYSTFLAFGASSTSTNVYRLMRSSGSGGVQNLLLYTGTTGYLVGALSPAGSWNHLAVTVAGSGPNQVKAYLNGVLKVTTSGNPSTVAQKFFIASDGRDMWLNGSAAGVKSYDVPLTDAEIAAEMQRLTPVRTAGLNAVYPLQSAATATTDDSGLNRTLTATGTLSTDPAGPSSLGGAALSTPEDTPLTGTLTATDVDGDPLAYSIVANGSQGTAVITNGATGAFTYTPNPDATGTDTFTFKASDGLLDSNIATVTLRITGVNDPPVAFDGVATVTSGSSVAGTLVASDVDGANRTFAIVANGSKGTAAIVDAAAGSYTYAANAGATGTDTFTFTVNDGAASSNIGTVTVTIVSGSSPVANAGSLTVTEDTVATGALVGSDPGGAALTYSIVTNGTRGVASVTNFATGAFRYTPNSNATGTDSFTFRVATATATSNVATVLVTINPVNDAPVAANGTASVVAGGSVTATLVATDVDSASRTFSIVANGTKGTATVTDATTGAFSYAANAGTSGSDTFTFRANDGSLDSNVATVTITIAAPGGNSPPVPMSGGSVSATSLHFDSSSDELYRTTNLPSPTSFTIMGWFRFTGDTTVYSSFFRLGHATNSSGYNMLRCCGSGWRQLDLWNGLADRKVASATLGTWYHLAVTVEGSGPGQVKVYVNGTLALVVDGNPNVTAARLSIGNDAHLEWLDGSGAAVKIYDVPLSQQDIAQEMTRLQPVRTLNLHAWYPLQTAESATADLSGNSRTLLKGGTLTTDSNGPPIDAGYTTSLNTTFTGILRATDPNGDPLTFSLSGPAAHGTVTVNPNGTFTYTPAPGYTGNDTFSFTVSDGIATATGSITVVIVP